MALNDGTKPIENDADAAEPITVGGDDTDQTDDAQDDAGDLPPVVAQEGQPPPSTRGGTRPGGSATRPSKWVSRKDLDNFQQSQQQIISQLQQTIIDMQGRLATPQSGNGQPQPTAEETQLQGLAQQMQQLVNLAANPDLSMEQRTQLGQQYNQLDKQRQQIERVVMKRELTGEILRELRGEMPDPQIVSMNAVLTQEFPHVMSNSTARRIAKSYYEDLVAKNHGNETPGLLRQAAAWAARSLGLGSAAPSHRDRAAGGGIGGRGGQRSTGERTFSPEELEIMRGAGVSPEQVAAYEAANPEDY